MERIFENYLEKFKNYLRQEQNITDFRIIDLPKLIYQYSRIFEKKYNIELNIEEYIKNEEELEEQLNTYASWDDLCNYPVLIILIGKKYNDEDFNKKIVELNPDIFPLANLKDKYNENFIKELSESAYKLFLFSCDLSILDEKTLEIVLRDFPYYYIRKEFIHANNLTNKTVIKKLLEKDNEFLEYLNYFKIDNSAKKELIDKYISSTMVINIPKLNLDNEIELYLIKKLLKEDGNKFFEIQKNKRTIELFEIAISSQKFFPEFIKNKAEDPIFKNIEYVEILLNYHPSYIRLVDKSIINKELIDILFDSGNIDFYELIQKIKDNSILLEYSLQKLATTKINNKNLNISFLDSNIIKYYPELSIKVIENIFNQIDPNLVNRIKKMLKITPNFLKTTSIEYITGDFAYIQDELGNEMAFNIGADYVYIIPLLKDLNKKQKDLLIKLFKLAEDINNKNNNNYTNSNTYNFDVIIKSFYDKRFDLLYKDVLKGKEVNLDNLLTTIFMPNNLVIKNIDELNNLDKTINNYTNDLVNKNNIADIKNAILLKIYMMDLEHAKKLVDETHIEDNSGNVVSTILKSIKKIISSQNKEQLKNLYDSLPMIEKDYNVINTISNESRIHCSKEIISTLYKVPQNTGFKIIELNGEFNLLTSTITGKFGNFQKETTIQQDELIGGYNTRASCIVSNSNLAIAYEQESICTFGFCNIPSDSILTISPYDFGSVRSETTKFRGIFNKNITYKMTSKYLLNATRNGHNEIHIPYAMIKEGKISPILPDYLIYTYETEKLDKTDKRWINTNNIAMSMNIPILTINRRKIAEQEHQKLNNKLKKLTIAQTEKDLEGIEEIITIFENNLNGCLEDNFEYIENNYFSSKNRTKLYNEIITIINLKIQENNLELVNIIINKLENAINKEIESLTIYYGDQTNTTKKISYLYDMKYKLDQINPQNNIHSKEVEITNENNRLKK